VTLNLSPSSFYLFSVAADSGQAVGVGGSPFDLTNANQTFAFDGSPATHLVQWQGYILGLSGSGCQVGGLNNQSCFVQTGVLGTLRTGQSFIGLGDNGAGQLVGVVNASSSFDPYNSVCTSGCPVQLIDIPTRTILAQKTYPISDLSTVVRVAYDPTCGEAVIGYTKIGSTVYSSTGYRVQELAF
jgi:hypothetical protein